MTEAFLVVASLAALACPLHALWRWRRGRGAACRDFGAGAADSVSARQRQLADRVRSVREARLWRGGRSTRRPL